jgi:Tfp pilus assembly protein PilV
MAASPDRSRFSLVEALISLTITAVIVTAMATILVDTKDVERQLWKRLRFESHQDAILSLLQDDLSRIYVPSTDMESLWTSSLEVDERNVDGLAFLIVDHSDQQRQLHEIEYLCSPHPNDSERILWYRRTSPWDGEPNSGGIYEQLSDQLSSVSILYRENDDWTDLPSTWPSAIKIATRAQLGQQDIHTTKTMALLGGQL